MAVRNSVHAGIRFLRFGAGCGNLLRRRGISKRSNPSADCSDHDPQPGARPRDHGDVLSISGHGPVNSAAGYRVAAVATEHVDRKLGTVLDVLRYGARIPASMDGRFAAAHK